MENKYVALKIYNKFYWKTVLRILEKNNYRWASGDKPTHLFFDEEEGIVYINPIRKTLAISSLEADPDRWNYYIEVR